MDAKNSQYRQIIEEGFKSAAFVNDIGITLLNVGPGWCESSMPILPHHLQHGGVVHAGVQATIADHTAGGAATTLLEQSQYVVTAVGETLICRAQVLKPGKALIVVEAEVFAISGTTRTLVSKTTVTLSVVTAGK